MNQSQGRRVAIWMKPFNMPSTSNRHQRQHQQALGANLELARGRGRLRGERRRGHIGDRRCERYRGVERADREDPQATGRALDTQPSDPPRGLGRSQGRPGRIKDSEGSTGLEQASRSIGGRDVGELTHSVAAFAQQKMHQLLL